MYILKDMPTTNPNITFIKFSSGLQHVLTYSIVLNNHKSWKIGKVGITTHFIWKNWGSGSEKRFAQCQLTGKSLFRIQTQPDLLILSLTKPKVVQISQHTW